MYIQKALINNRLFFKSIFRISTNYNLAVIHQ